MADNEEVSTPPQTDAVPAEPVSLDEYKALKNEEVAEQDPEKADEKTVEVRERTFRVAKELPGIVLLDLGLASDPSATQGEQLRAVRQFLHAAIHEDDVDAFEVHLRTARPVIEMDELNKVVEELVEKTSGRPTS